MARNPGRFVEVTDGVHKGKKGFFYNKEQSPEVVAAKKRLVWIDDEVRQGDIFDQMDKIVSNARQKLIDITVLKVIGYID